MESDSQVYWGERVPESEGDIAECTVPHGVRGLEAVGGGVDESLLTFILDCYPPPFQLTSTLAKYNNGLLTSILSLVIHSGQAFQPGRRSSGRPG